MGDDNEKNSEEKGALNPDDLDLWKEMTGDVKPLPGKKYGKAAEKAPLSREEPVREIALTPRKTTKKLPPKGREIDRKTEERFRKGKMPIEGTLDLHGMTQDQALPALRRFILSSYSSGKRCLLVITGKGTKRGTAQDRPWYERQPGILKEQVPVWLAGADLKDIVLRAHEAKHHDGGSGALYVLLRRQRD